MPPSAPLIKGYLPIRLKLGNDDETFFYVREHQGKSNDNHKGCTLFVANAPVVPGISTKILLSSIFGRYAEISRVSVVPNPRQQQEAANSKICASWSDKVSDPSFLPPIYSEGNYAHIVFDSPKVLKKTMNALKDVMTRSSKKKEKELPGLSLERLEFQTLADETAHQYRKNLRKSFGNGSDDDDDEDKEEEKQQTGILAVAQRYRQSFNLYSREQLLEECNAVMEAYEDAEEEKRRAKEALKDQPDDDGFIAVSHSSAAVGTKDELEESGTTIMRRKGNKRSRKKKDAVGSSELKDFYRFQRRENKKRSLEELRTQFEEDLKKVKKMKEDHQYRPF